MNFSKGHSGFIENIFILILIAFHLVLGLVIPISNFLSKVDMMQHHMLALGITRTWDVTYHDLKELYWWTRMKRWIAQFVNECDVCRRVKAEHQRPAGLLQPLAIP